MSDETVPQFGRSLREEPSAAPTATSCPTCGSRFSPDGRFCPFDGTPLTPASGWDPSKDALLGRVVDGRYEVLSVLGEGGMGTVYEVRHRMLGKRFALKALRRELATDGEIAARFIQEARTAAAVSHPGLVEITDFGELESGQVYFVMELLTGCSLAALLRQGGPLPAARGLAIVRQLALALKAAHDAAIVHRDLKPDNIHIARGDGDTDVVKILDFGLAKVIGSSRLTRAGMVFGTPHYMSPEQAAGEPVDHRADIYALGIVMYEMFTGKVPFEADSYMGVLTKHMYMAPGPPSELCPELKALGALEDVILRCLQKRPQARYPDLAALWADLEQRLPGGATQRPPAPPSLLAEHLELPQRVDVAPRPSPRLWPIVALGFGLLALAGVVAAWRAVGGSSSPPRAASVARPAPVAPPVVLVLPASIPEPALSASSQAVASASHPPVSPPPSRKPVRTEPKPTRTVQPAPAKRRLPGGEIVDPWAN